MFNRAVAIAVAVSILHLTWTAPLSASPSNLKETQFSEKLRAEVLSLGTGEKVRVQLRLRDQSRLKGYISAAGQDSFTVTDPKTGTSTRVAYPKIKSVKGQNLSKGTKISIGVLVGIGILVMILLGMHLDDN